MEKIEVLMNATDSAIVELSFHEYNSTLSIINYLIKDNDIDKNLLQEYNNEADRRYIKLELYKNMMSKKYLPKICSNKNYNFSFNFDENKIIYEY